MTDGKLARESLDRFEAAPKRDWDGMRKEVRALIRAEVDKLNPTEDARRPLELIVESSVRYADVDGALAITVVDSKGQPRTVEKNGRTVEMTIYDLLEELRLSHRMLFRQTARNNAPAMAEPMPAQEPSGAVDAAPRPAVKPQRDWLNVSVGEPSPAADPARNSSGGFLLRLKRGRVRYHGWVRRTRKAVTSLAGVDEAPVFPFVEDRPRFSLDWVRTMAAGIRARAGGRGRNLAIGAVALATLFGIGALALAGRDQPPSPAPEISTGSDGPAATGTVRMAQAESAQSSPPVSSANRTLRGVPDVIDTATLSLQGEVVRLFGVEWAPGGGKPDDLTRYLQGREVVCEPAGSNDTYRCQVGGQDLSRVVLFNGGGKPTAEATAELKAAADKAREARLGVWNQQSQ